MPRSLWVAGLAALVSCSGPEANTGSSDFYERFLGVKELEELPDAEAAPKAVKFLDDPHFLVVVGALEVLADLGSPEFLQHAAAKLKPPSPEQPPPHPMVRIAACGTIAAIRNAAGIPILVEVLKSDGEVGVRREAAKMLATFGNRPEVRQALLEALADKDPSVAYMAHEMLGAITGRTVAARTKEAWTQALQ